MTEIEAHKVFAVLCSLFPSAKTEPWERRDEQGNMKPIPGGGTRGAYARMLADLEYAPACAAVERVAATHMFPTVMPAIAEIRTAYADLVRGPERAGGEAWGDIARLMSSTKERMAFSAHRFPTEGDVEDKISWRCIDALGWLQLCNSENHESDRARFIELYDKLAKTARRDEVTRTLPAATKLRELASGIAGKLAARRDEVTRTLPAAQIAATRKAGER